MFRTRSPISSEPYEPKGKSQLELISGITGAVASAARHAMSLEHTSEAVNTIAASHEVFRTAAGVVGGIAAGAATLNPITLPAVAICALIISKALQKKAAHSKLLEVMRSYVDQMVRLVRFTSLADFIFNAMVEHNPELIHHNYEQLAVKEAADDLRLSLIIFANPSLFKDLSNPEAGVIQAGNIDRINAGRYLKIESILGQLYEKMFRIMSAESIAKKLDEKMQNLFNTSAVMRTQFLLFISIYRNDFEGILDDVKKNTYYTALFSLESPSSVKTVPDNATDEEAGDSLEKNCNDGLQSGNTLDSLSKGHITYGLDSVVGAVTTVVDETPDPLERPSLAPLPEPPVKRKFLSPFAPYSTTKDLSAAATGPSVGPPAGPQGGRRKVRKTRKSKRRIRRKTVRRH
jgi:hypothetical protein